MPGMSIWITDARAFASAHESKVPEEARRAELVRQIVEAATSRRAEGSWCSAVRCIARASRKACSARILVAQTGAGRVDWSCTACGDRGVITGFEGTEIDLSSYVPREKKLRIWGFDDEERSALLAGTTHIPSLRAVVARASPAAEIKGLLILQATVDELDVLACPCGVRRAIVADITRRHPALILCARPRFSHAAMQSS